MPPSRGPGHSHPTLLNARLPGSRSLPDTPTCLPQNPECERSSKFSEQPGCRGSGEASQGGPGIPDVPRQWKEGPRPGRKAAQRPPPHHSSTTTLSPEAKPGAPSPGIYLPHVQPPRQDLPFSDLGALGLAGHRGAPPAAAGPARTLPPPAPSPTGVYSPALAPQPRKIGRRQTPRARATTLPDRHPLSPAEVAPGWATGEPSSAMTSPGSAPLRSQSAPEPRRQPALSGLPGTNLLFPGWKVSEGGCQGAPDGAQAQAMESSREARLEGGALSHQGHT